VAAGAELVAARQEIFAQRPMVVDLTVEDDPAGAVLVRHRLRAAGAIDDRQPRVAERRTRIGERALAVRTTMMKRVRHLADGVANRRIQIAVRADDAADTAHRVALLPNLSQTPQAGTKPRNLETTKKKPVWVLNGI